MYGKPIINVNTAFDTNRICLEIHGKYLIDGVHNTCYYKSGWNDIEDGLRIELKQFDHKLQSMWKVIVGIIYGGKKIYYVFYPKKYTTKFDMVITFGEKYPIIKLNESYADNRFSDPGCVTM
jgi:hypothetical protein